MFSSLPSFRSDQCTELGWQLKQNVDVYSLVKCENIVIKFQQHNVISSNVLSSLNKILYLQTKTLFPSNRIIFTNEIMDRWFF